jgi:isopentenyldiphosphate isomerase
MSQRYTGEISLSSSQEKAMRINMKAMFWITVFHIMLVLYSARFLSDEAWAFISGGLFYIFFAVYFAFLWIINKIRNNRIKNEEWFPVVDEKGNVIGTAPRSVCHDGKSKLLHPVVHLHLFNKEGKLFLQKRSAEKDIQPGKWDTSVGGHIAPGEKLEDALSREVREEINILKFNPQFIQKYVWESEMEKELVFSFLTVSEEQPSVNKEEIEEGRYWSLDEIRGSIGKGLFTPNFEHEFSLLVKSIQGAGKPQGQSPLYP